MPIVILSFLQPVPPRGHRQPPVQEWQHRSQEAQKLTALLVHRQGQTDKSKILQGGKQTALNNAWRSKASRHTSSLGRKEPGGLAAHDALCNRR